MDNPTRQCYRCRRDLPLTKFYVASEARRNAKLGRTGMAYPCRDCNREIAFERMRPRRALIEAAKLAGCADCGIQRPDHPEIFDFDHPPGAEKVGRGVNAFLTKGTLEDLAAEIAKCEVVCANCHRIRTKQREPMTRGVDRIPVHG